MEEDNRTSTSLGEYVAIELTTDCVWCGVVCVCACVYEVSTAMFRWIPGPCL